MRPKLGKIVHYLIIAVIIVICLFPPYVILISSLQQEQQVFSIPASFWPNPAQLKNYSDIWSVMPLAKYIRNGLFVSMGAIGLTLFVGCMAAYPLARLRIPGRKLVMTTLLFTQMFAPAVVLLPLFRIFQALSLLNTLTGLIIVNSAFSLAFSTLLIAGFFETVPHEVLEAATIDGCGKLGILWRILMPVSSSGILVVAIYIFTNVWNEFLFAFTFISSNDKFTPIVGLFSFIQVPGVQLPQWHLAMAVAVVLSIPALVLFYARRNSLAKGLSAGAIK